MLVNTNKESLQVNPGDFLIIDTPGGGGWGKPTDWPEDFS
jgi:N-methylhydantoinase B/oxoprolinase/acetone carboxylase alpha subunit